MNFEIYFTFEALYSHLWVVPLDILQKQHAIRHLQVTIVVYNPILGENGAHDAKMRGEMRNIMNFEIYLTSEAL